MANISIQKAISNLASRYPIVVIQGQRGTGARDLVRSMFPRKSFVDLEDRRTFSLAKQSPRTFLMAFPDGAVINAASRLPAIAEALGYHVLKWGFVPGKYIILCDDASVFDTADGKVGICHAGGLTVQDTEDLKMQSSNPFQIIANGQLYDVLRTGKDPEEIIRETLEKDAGRFINVSNTQTFLSFMRNCALSSARPFSMNALAKASGISAPTSKSWISVLLKTALVRSAESEDGDRVLFFSDTGILCRLLGINSYSDLILSDCKDSVVRTFAFNELLRGRFSKCLEPLLFPGSCCDLTAEWRDGFSIVVDSNIEVTDESMNRARSLKKEDGPRAVILYLGDVTYSRDGVDCIGFRDWGKLAMEMNYFS